MEFPLVRKTTVDGLPADIGIGVVFPIRSSLLATGLPVLTCAGIAPVALGFVSNIERGLPKTFPCVPDQFQVSSGMLRSRLNIDRGLGRTAG